MFRIKKIKNKIYKIEERCFKENANLYLLKGDKFDLLIDSGLGFFNLKEFLKKKGFYNIKVVLTHSHFDHVLGIKDFFPKEVLIHDKIHDNLQNEELLGYECFDEKDVDRNALSEIKFKDIKISKFEKKKLERIDNGTFCFELIETPGHTDDSVVYYDRKSKILITGDVLYDGEVYFQFPNSNKKEFKKSLKRILNYDFDLVLPGHNQIFNKLKAVEIIEKWNKKL